MSTPLLQALATLRSARWVDLTHPFAPGIPHYSGFPDEQRATVIDYDQGFRTESYTHVGQWGTHVDPPAHFIPGGRTLDQLPVTDMLLELVVLDAVQQARADPDYAVDRALIAEHEGRYGAIPSGSFVALRTGWSERWPDLQNGGHYPGWTVDALEFLVDQRDVRAVGHEQTDTDPGTELAAGRVDAERYLLGRDRWQVEMLTGLGGLPERGGLILARWAKPEGGSGFPARCVAIVPG